MQSTTTSSFNQILAQINQIDLNNFLQLFKLAATSTTTENQKKVFDMLKQVQSRTESYLYFLFVFLNPQYDQTLRYITGTTMKSALERNSKDLHFDHDLKHLMKNALLQTLITGSQKLRSTQNILISQLAICFEEVDWQLIYFLITKTPENPEILPLLCTIFEDLKHNSENLMYFQRATQTQVIQALLKTVHEMICANIGQENFIESELNVKTVSQCLRLIKTVTFHLPLKLSQYFEMFVNQIVLPLLKFFGQIFDKDIIAKVLSSHNISGIKSLVSQFFQSINQISQTKSQYLLQNKDFLDHFIIYFPISNETFRKAFHDVLKTWTNVILQLLINDQTQQQDQQPSEEYESVDYSKLRLFSYLQIIVSRVLVGFRFSKEDELHILHEMQLEHNPYQNEQHLIKEGQVQSDEEGNFQTTHGKAHGSTLRKISITCVQKLCQQYQAILWENNKNLIYQLLKNESDYKLQQSGVVFIGIVAQNCIEEIRQDSKEILQFLSAKSYKVNHEILLASTLWAFEKLLPTYLDSPQTKNFVYQMIYKVLGNREEYSDLKNSKNLMVKEAAVSLLDELLSQQTQVDLQIIQTMLQCLIYALETFSGRALFNVFKAISSIFQQPQRQGVQAILVSEVVKHLCVKWVNSLQKDSIMCPLIECLSYICENRKKYFIEYSLEILQQIYPLFKETERKSLVLRVIDLATAIIVTAREFPDSEGFNKVKTVSSSQEFLTMVNNLVLSEEKEIRHFGYGLLSDIVKLKGVSDHQADHFIQIIAQSMDRENSTSINNALMCLTDIIDQHREVGAKYTREILQVIVEFIYKFPNSNLPKIYLLNFSRMFGRLSLIDVNSAKELCLSGKFLLKQLSDGLRSQEKSQLTLNAYQGLTNILTSLSAGQLTSYLESKQIQHFIDSFMGYKFNLESNQNMQGLNTLFNQIKTLLIQKNISWGQYLNSTMLFPATINRILQMNQ